MITQTLLQGKRVILEPLEDIDYLLDLADKDNQGFGDREQLRDLIKTNGGEFWLITLNGSRRGVAGYFIINGVYMLEVLKDKTQPSTGISYSIEVGNLILDYLFGLIDKVRTFARIEDRAIQLLCLKLGFIEFNRFVHEGQEFIIYQKERQCH